MLSTAQKLLLVLIKHNTTLIALLKCYHHMQIQTILLALHQQSQMSSIPPPPQFAFQSTQGVSRQLFHDTMDIIPAAGEKITTFILDNEAYLYTFTNFTLSEFNELHEHTLPVLTTPLKGEQYKHTSLTTKDKLLLVLMWVRRYYTLSELCIWFGLSRCALDLYLNAFVVRLCEFLRPEISFPSPDRLNMLLGIHIIVKIFCIYVCNYDCVGSIPEFPTTVGSMDMTIHRLNIPAAAEYRFFRGDKGCHFYNSLGMCDFSGMFLFFQAGFAGRLTDRQALQASELPLLLNNLDVDALGDRGFSGEPHIITPANDTDRVQMKDRAIIECTWHELHAEAEVTHGVWRHNKRLHAPTMTLAAELHNFRKRKRLNKVLKLYDQHLQGQYQRQ